MGEMTREAPAAAPVRTGPASEPRMGGVLGAGLVSAALFAISLVLPLVFLVGIVSPVPIVLLRLRAGSTAALLAAALAAALVAGIFAPGPALMFLFAFVAPGIVIGHAMARGRGLVRGCAWAFALVFLEIAMGLVFAGPTLQAGALAPFDELLSQKALGDLASRVTPEQLAEWKTHLTEWRAIMSVIYPGAFVVCGGLCVLANAVVLRTILARRDPGWLEGGEFESLRAPSILAFAFVLCGASVAFPPARPFAYNALLVLGFFFALQGLAVTAFYAHRLAGPPFLRVAVVLLVIVSPWPAQILALLGLFDLFFNFRKWAVPPEARQG